MMTKHLFKAKRFLLNAKYGQKIPHDIWEVFWMQGWVDGTSCSLAPLLTEKGDLTLNEFLKLSNGKEKQTSL